MKRCGQVIGIKPDHIAAYESIHADVWPEVLAMIHACNMCNYSIFRHGTFLFAYFEYIGDDFQADMATMAADPKTQAWWAITAPMQEPFADRMDNEWWTTMQTVFHSD